MITVMATDQNRTTSDNSNICEEFVNLLQQQTKLGKQVFLPYDTVLIGKEKNIAQIQVSVNKHLHLKQGPQNDELAKLR